MGTDDWWALLRGVAALNVAALGVVAWRLWRMRAQWPPDAWLTRRWQLLLAAGYVLGCAWRSLFPVFDVQRLVLVDSFCSSVVIGRSIATLAELCFAAQWALLLREVARTAGSASGMATSRAVLPLIATAELFSWYSVLTTSNIGHVVEESLWALSASMMVVSLLRMWRQVECEHRPLLALWCALGSAYVAYMLSVDVPMYWSRWLADEAISRSYLTLTQGWLDVSIRWVVSHQWEHWRSEVLWMTGYFSVAVWLSIALVLVPRVRPAAATAPV